LNFTPKIKEIIEFENRKQLSKERHLKISPILFCGISRQGKMQPIKISQIMFCRISFASLPSSGLMA